MGVGEEGGIAFERGRVCSEVAAGATSREEICGEGGRASVE